MVDGVAQNVRVLAGRYEIGELIGRGGMADVHVGVDTRLGRKVAIKLLKPSLAYDPAFRSRFRREAQDAAKMAHPTIVRIFDAGEESYREQGGVEALLPFIVMEFVDGRLLKDVVAEGAMPPAEAARVVGQVLTALEYSHRAGVVHRDIKPGNIMITSSGQVKVMDFGIARAISDSSATLAETSAIVGTASYFSPEQARGETVDARTDLYSTGIVLFELLTGRAPFRGDNPVAVAYQHVNAEAAPPSSLNPVVSPAMDAVVLRALAKDRFERYQSAAEFRADVESAAAGDVPQRKQVAVNDGFTQTLFGVNPTATAGSEATLRQLAVDRDQRIERTQSRPPVAWIWAGVVALAVIIVAVVFWTFSLQSVQLVDNAPDVPDVVGQTYEDGAKTLSDATLAPQRFNEASTTVAAGVIIRTDPGSGTTVAEGQQVRVYVSSGMPQTAVPDVTRFAQADAIAAIQNAKLTDGAVNSTFSPDLPEGTVISTDPVAGTEVDQGATINLNVSNGQVEIPDYTGRTVGEANTEFGRLQLTVRTSVDASCTGGVVRSQDLKGAAPQRSTVNLVVCL